MFPINPTEIAIRLIEHGNPYLAFCLMVVGIGALVMMAGAVRGAASAAAKSAGPTFRKLVRARKAPTKTKRLGDQ